MLFESRCNLSNSSEFIYKASIHEYFLIKLWSACKIFREANHIPYLSKNSEMLSFMGPIFELNLFFFNFCELRRLKFSEDVNESRIHRYETLIKTNTKCTKY